MQPGKKIRTYKRKNRHEGNSGFMNRKNTYAYQLHRNSCSHFPADHKIHFFCFRHYASYHKKNILISATFERYSFTFCNLF